MAGGRPRVLRVTAAGCPTCGKIRTVQHEAALQGDVAKVQKVTVVRTYHERQVHHG